MLPDLVSNPGPMTNESGALSIALRGPALLINSILPISTVVFLLSLTECAIFYAYEYENANIS